MNEAPDQYLRVEERHYSAHHNLLHIAELSLQKAEAHEPGWFNEAFICITFSALAIEALANAIGHRVVADWPAFERLSPKEKIKHLKRTLKVSSTNASAVWASVTWLNSFRNDIAHPKPEHIKQELLLAAKPTLGRFDAPESKLEKRITVERARDAFEAVYKAKRILCSHVPTDLSEGLEVDGWFSSTTTVSNPGSPLRE